MDEHDMPFRNTYITMKDPLLVELIRQETGNGISLMVFCGLTRMVGSGLSRINNLEDVSQWTKYHSICGISARELVKCTSRKLNRYAQKQYNQTFQEVVQNDFCFKVKWIYFKVEWISIWS
jgi:hypothetical protein